MGPIGRVVLVAVRGTGLECLDGTALRALQRVGASAAQIYDARPNEAYALIGIKGGPAVSERRGWSVDVEGQLPQLRPSDPTLQPTSKRHERQQNTTVSNVKGSVADNWEYFEKQRGFLAALQTTSRCPEQS